MNKQASEGSLIKVGLGYLLVVTVVVVFGCLLYDLTHEYFGWPRLPLKSLALWGGGSWFALCWFCPVILLAWDRLAVARAMRVTGAAVDAPISPFSKEPVPDDDSWVAKLKEHLHENHGFLWRRKIRLLLVVGEPAQIAAIAPNLKDKKWLAGHDTVLLWGGSTQTKFADGRFSSWQGLSRWRGLDGVIWALNKEQSMDASAMDAGVRHLQDLARQLRWQLPLHLWQVCDSGWEQNKRQTQAIGCWLPSQVTPLALESGLESLVQPLRDGGWVQIRGAMNHDFLLRLSRDLQAEGIARWRQVLAPLFRVFDRGVPLRGLWFSLPVQGGQETKENTDNLWHATPPWDGVLDDKRVRPERLGWPATRIAQTLMLALT
ncbi:MAG: type VI secretion protein VasK, partial [Pseudomonas umsongensis]|nr:type VI secretion protein VasK [Pseudomonas umsongensis]